MERDSQNQAGGAAKGRDPSHTPFVGARILKIGLRSGTSSRMGVSLQDRRAFLGAATLGAPSLSPGLRPEVDPPDDEAPIALLTGSLTGTADPAFGQAVFCAGPPATGLWATSNIGGFLGSERMGHRARLDAGQFRAIPGWFKRRGSGVRLPCLPPPRPVPPLPIQLMAACPAPASEKCRLPSAAAIRTSPPERRLRASFLILARQPLCLLGCRSRSAPCREAICAP